MERRRRWVVVPRFIRGTLVLRTVLAPLVDRASAEVVSEADQRFQQDVESRGVEAASAPVGAGGQAVAERQPAGY